jgi:hypothetical protein
LITSLPSLIASSVIGTAITPLVESTGIVSVPEAAV